MEKYWTYNACHILDMNHFIPIFNDRTIFGHTLFRATLDWYLPTFSDIGRTRTIFFGTTHSKSDCDGKLQCIFLLNFFKIRTQQSGRPGPGVRVVPGARTRRDMCPSPTSLEVSVTVLHIFCQISLGACNMLQTWMVIDWSIYPPCKSNDYYFQNKTWR